MPITPPWRLGTKKQFTKKQSSADKHLLVILGLIALILWFADRNTYDISLSFVENYPAPVFIGAAFIVALVIYMISDPYKDNNGLPVPVKNAIVILYALTALIILGAIASSNFRTWVLHGGELVQYVIVIILGLAFLSFIFSPPKGKTWGDTTMKYGMSLVVGGGLSAVAFVFGGPVAAVPAFVFSSSVTSSILSKLGY